MHKNDFKFIIIFCLISILYIPKKSFSYVRCNGSNELCPQVNSLKYTDFPGVTDENGSGFSRNQDTYGICGRFSDVDSICYKLKSLGLWKSKSNCSVMDYQLWVYNKKHKKNGTLDELLTEDDKKIDNLSHEEILTYAKNIGFCPEDRFRSEFMGNNYGSKEYFKKNLSRDVNSRFSKIKSEAQFSLPGNCPECAELSPVLTNEQWKSVNVILANTTNSDPKLAAFNKINDLACPDSVRIKLPKGYSLQSPNGQDPKNWIDAALNQKEVLVIKIGGKTLDPSLGVADPSVWDHSSILAGALCDQDSSKPEGVEHCYYMIKNSWGLNCRNMKDTEDRKCDKNSGAVLLSWNAISKGIDGGARVGTALKLGQEHSK